MEQVAHVPVLTGHKTERERFAGAVRTWTCEGMMGDGKALQMGTSHELGQNFSRVFGIQFSDPDGAQRFGWQTSWGASTRLIGALVMAHGDDFGLRLPPALAPVEVVVMVAREGEGVQRAAEALVADLAGCGRRARLDDRTGTGFGRRSVDWELKGVPVRVEMGPRELAEGQVTVVTRHRRSKELVPLAGLAATVSAVLDGVGPDLAAEARQMRESRTQDVADLGGAAAAAATGFARLPWAAVGPEGEARLAAEGLSVRCLQRPDGGLAAEGDEGSLVAVVGRAY
jgi:prolyl-tRNA synthetase